MSDCWREDGSEKRNEGVGGRLCPAGLGGRGKQSCVVGMTCSQSLKVAFRFTTTKLDAGISGEGDMRASCNVYSGRHVLCCRQLKRKVCFEYVRLAILPRHEESATHKVYNKHTM